jgi:hypothetical protein
LTKMPWGRRPSKLRSANVTVLGFQAADEQNLG